ncbi:unnamed protein product [Prorocentrum cordatum]|uniref:Hexosyltransferase n=1 Tax=Prorocentrum cordatum TaxID=2364126 RepID=A0ABN9R9C0_9DINO|nr:unnamed protein product [Polarella glacialis]
MILRVLTYDMKHMSAASSTDAKLAYRDHLVGLDSAFSASSRNLLCLLDAPPRSVRGVIHICCTVVFQVAAAMKSGLFRKLANISNLQSKAQKRVIIPLWSISLERFAWLVQENIPDWSQFVKALSGMRVKTRRSVFSIEKEKDDQEMEVPRVRARLWLLALCPCYSIPTMRRVSGDDPLRPTCETYDDPFDDLKDVRIYGLVYYGRRTYVDILNAYLERDLRANGGVLDLGWAEQGAGRGRWPSKQAPRLLESPLPSKKPSFEASEMGPISSMKPPCLLYKAALRASPPPARRQGRDHLGHGEVHHGGPELFGHASETEPYVVHYSKIPWHMEGGAWDVIWRLADEPGAYYVKIDDDTTYIAPGAFAEMVREKRRGRFLFVAANIVNHGILSAVHQEIAAIPDLEKPQIPEGADWYEQKLGPWRYRGDVMTDPGYRIQHSIYNDCVWRRWDCAALVHEALLWRLENNSSCAFDFGVYDFHSQGYELWFDGISRTIDWNDNFFVFKHEDFDDLDWEGVATDDERELSTLHPKRRQQHAAALGRAIVAHWTFSVQEKGLLANTTLLDRYRARAEVLMQENAERFYGGAGPEARSGGWRGGRRCARRGPARGAESY